MMLTCLVFSYLVTIVFSVSRDFPVCPNSPVCDDPSRVDCKVQNGCYLCTCPPPRPCGLPICKKPCPYGSKITKDLNGCDVCICLPRPTCPPTPACVLYARCRSFKKIDGCISPTCECNTDTCSPLTCTARDCPLGFATDSIDYGCPTCQCRRRQSPLACRPLPCLALLDCFGGSSVVKIRGCPVCLCGPVPVCPPIACEEPCRYGYVFEKGCQTCRCRPAPVTCPTLQCKRKTCSRGFASDSKGCPTCQCNRPKRRQHYLGRRHYGRY